MCGKGLLLAADDKSPSEIEQDEVQYFHQVGPERLALSRKLTLVSSMSEGFVADKRLWKWMAKAVTSEKE